MAGAGRGLAGEMLRLMMSESTGVPFRTGFDVADTRWNRPNYSAALSVTSIPSANAHMPPEALWRSVTCAIELPVVAAS